MLRKLFGVACVVAFCLPFVQANGAINKKASYKEVHLSPKLLSDIRTVLPCPNGMTALVRDGVIVMAWCVK